MLVVVTPATKKRLTTVTAARSRLGLKDTDVDNGILLDLIDTASALAEDYCRRTFAIETVRETLSFPNSLSEISFASPGPFELVSVTYDAVELDVTDFTVGANGRLYRNAGTEYWGAGPVVVTYRSGYRLPGEPNRNLPFAVEQAVIRMIGALHSSAGRDVMIKSEDVEGIGRVDYYVPGQGSILPEPMAERMLQPYVSYL